MFSRHESIYLVCSMMLAGSLQTSLAQSGPAADVAPQLDHFSTNNADKSVDPCTDFYHFACNHWIKDNPVPADEIFWGSFGKLQLWNRSFVHEMLIKISAKAMSERSPVEQKVGDYWSACMDEKQRNAAALDTLRPEIQQIDGMKSKGEIAMVLADLHRTIAGAWIPAAPETYAAMFGFGAQPDFHNTQAVIPQFDQGGMGLPGRRFYLDTDAKSVEIRQKYVAYIAQLYKLAGVPDAKANADADAVLRMETVMAKAAMDIVKRRDPHNLDNEMSLEAVKKLAPSFAWDRYLEGARAPASPKFIVTSPEFFRRLGEVLESEPLEHWKAYLRWALLNGNAPDMGDDFANANFEFYGKTLFGAKAIEPLWRRCVEAEDRDIGEAVGQAYAERAFSPESKERVKQMVANIKEALGEDIDSATWMSPQTRAQAHIKLAAQLDKIGYPDHWRDYSSLQIQPDSHLLNVHRSAAFELHRQLQKIGKPVDRSEWGMTPPTVNAYEDAQTNTSNFPAGILQPPFFDPAQDDVVNYGAVGAVIGHETVHGYDDQGRKFDSNGNLRDWWTSEDAKAYEKRSDCIADEYTEFVPEAGVKQDGRLTQGENTADNGGIRLALSALEKDLRQRNQSLDDKDTDDVSGWQRFFLAYANVWCSNVRPEMMRTLILTDPHPLDKYRVNNVLGNMPEFDKAFGCHQGQAMVHQNQCRVW